MFSCYYVPMLFKKGVTKDDLEGKDGWTTARLSASLPAAGMGGGTAQLQKYSVDKGTEIDQKANANLTSFVLQYNSPAIQVNPELDLPDRCEEFRELCP